MLLNNYPGDLLRQWLLTSRLFTLLIAHSLQYCSFTSDCYSNYGVCRQEPHRGPWKVTLNDSVYEPFMTHCPDRKLRSNVWMAYNNRCSYSQQTENLSNSKTIQDIRRSRNYLASVVGYSNFAQMSMETKMAGSVENVQSVLQQ